MFESKRLHRMFEHVISPAGGDGEMIKSYETCHQRTSFDIVKVRVNISDQSKEGSDLDGTTERVQVYDYVTC